MRLLVFLFFFMMLLDQRCWAANYQLKDEVLAYNYGNFEQTILIGSQIIERDPEDDTAHYYLANAYCRLNRLSEAASEYNCCIRLTKDPAIKSYSEMALQAISNSQTNPSPSSYPSPGQLTTADSDEAKRISEEENHVLNRHSREAQERIDTINNDAKANIANVPKEIYQYDPIDDCADRVPNPDYDSIVDNINRKAQVKIHAINEELSETQQLVRASYQQRLNAVLP